MGKDYYFPVFLEGGGRCGTEIMEIRSSMKVDKENVFSKVGEPERLRQKKHSSLER